MICSKVVLPAPAGSDDADYFVGHDVEVDAFEYFETVERFAYVAYGYDGLFVSGRGKFHNGE